MAIDTAAKLLSVLDGDPTTTPGMPFPGGIGTPEKLHLLWLYSGTFDEDPREDEPTPVPAPSIPLQRWLVRTGPIDQFGQCTVDDCLLFVKRGLGGNASEPHIRFRANRDNKGFGKWITRGLGRAGDRGNSISIGGLGTAHVWQFEAVCDDDCDIELQEIKMVIRRTGH